MKIFVVPLSILTGKFVLVSRSVFRIMFSFSWERFSFCAAFLIIVFAFCSSMCECVTNV